MKKTYSILRAAQEDEIRKLTLNGSILDVGGDTNSEYPKLINGDFTVHSINISDEYNPDEIVDIEERFPYNDAVYDNVICFNVLEHIVETQHAISEMIRVAKPGGKIVITTPFLYFVHGSPDDFQRYTGSFYRRMAEKYGCKVELIAPLGNGFFSIGFNFVGGVLPTHKLKLICKSLAISLDNGLYRVSKKYRKLYDKLPMGYFVVFVKE